MSLQFAIGGKKIDENGNKSALQINRQFDTTAFLLHFINLFSSFDFPLRPYFYFIFDMHAVFLFIA